MSGNCRIKAVYFVVLTKSVIYKFATYLTNHESTSIRKENCRTTKV